MEAFYDAIRNCLTQLYGINTHPMTLEQIAHRYKWQVKPTSNDIIRDHLYEEKPVKTEWRKIPTAEEDVLDKKQRTLTAAEEHVETEEQFVPAEEEKHVEIEKQFVPVIRIHTEGVDCSGRRSSLESSYEQNWNSHPVQETPKEESPSMEVGVSGSDIGMELKNMRDDIQVIKAVISGFAEKTDIDVKNSLRLGKTTMSKEMMEEMKGPINKIVQGISKRILNESVIPVIRELKSAGSLMDLKDPKSSDEDATSNMQDVIVAAVRQEFECLQKPAVTYAKLEDGWMDYLTQEISAGSKEIIEMKMALATAATNVATYAMDQDDEDSIVGAASDASTIATLKQEIAGSKKLVEDLQTELRCKDDTIKGLQCEAN